MGIGALLSIVLVDRSLIAKIKIFFLASSFSSKSKLSGDQFVTSLLLLGKRHVSDAILEMIATI